MRFSMEWLKDYIDINLSAEELAEKLTLAGVEVEGVTPFQDIIKNVVVGKVLAVRPHGYADKLTVVDVDAGSNRYSVVCGAHNIRDGDLVPFALPGAVLDENREIVAREIRGVKSHGMLCSAEELGLEIVQDPEGILILDEELKPGTDLNELLYFDDQILELGLTPNRADCLGLLGIAHEVAALTGEKLKLPHLNPKEAEKRVEQELEVDVHDPGLCPRYTARLIKDVNVSPSPLWLQRRLLAVGIRPINNVVDVTNYVMWETGQPLHAFDSNLVAEGNVIIRRARPGEKMVTLDGVERTLDEDMLVIADKNRAIGLAGVMGGENTEINSETTGVILEAAFFNEVNIRRTAKKLSLTSDASQRFERGVNPEGVLIAQNRAAYLIGALTGGKVSRGVVDRTAEVPQPARISLRHQRVHDLLGLKIETEKIETIFRSLGFSFQKKQDAWDVDIPLRRRDVKIEADLIEEIARIYGYEHIPATLPQGVLSEGRETLNQRLRSLAAEALVACGFQEIISFSFMNPRAFDMLELPADDSRRKSIDLQNPLSEEQKTMRTTLVPNMLQTIYYNLNHQVANQMIFEMGSVFWAKELPLQELPREQLNLSLGATGLITENNWQGQQIKVDFFFLKGAVETLFRRLGINNYCFQAEVLPVYHPTRAAAILLDGEQAGTIGELHSHVQENFDIKQKVYIAELDFELLMDKSSIIPKYRQLPRYPAVLRDIAVVVSKDIPCVDIYNCIRKTGGDLVEGIQLFDLYEGEQIPQGCRSLAFSIRYRSAERTLTDEDVNTVHQQIELALAGQFGAQLRK